jgi:hypothetical protein
MSTSEMTVDQINRALATGYAGIEQAKAWVDRWNGCGFHLATVSIVEIEVSHKGLSRSMIAPKVILSDC